MITTMKHTRLIAIAGGIVFIIALPLLVFIIRSPVLIVNDMSFAALYGKENMQRQKASTERALYRRVKPVIVADGAGIDMITFAIAEASRRPFCVLFSRSNAAAARFFHDQFPEIPAVVLSGLVSVPEVPSPDGILCVYGTNREVDLYRAGLCAGILGKMRYDLTVQTEEKELPPPQSYALWQDIFVQEAGKELFSRGVREYDPESAIVFADSAAEMPDDHQAVCVVLTGAGAEYLEKNPSIPLILFSWLDPALTAQEIAVQFDDSPWALAVPAARMAAQRQIEGKIPSKAVIITSRVTDKTIFRLLRKSAKKMP